MTEQITATAAPQPIPEMPVPPTLGGGLMPIFRVGDRIGLCSVPGCKETATTACRFVLLHTEGEMCKKPLCESHSMVVGDCKGFCPSHERFLAARTKQ
jgi:hypothetical protein